MARRPVELLVLPLALVAAWPSAAGAATASGTYRLERPAGSSPASHAAWTIRGPLLGARAEAPAVGVGVSPQLVDTDSRYVTATLTEAEQAPETTDCGDGTGASTTIGVSDVASAPSAFEADLVLDLLRGRGTAHLNVAETAYPGAIGTYFAPGLANWSYASACYDSSDVRTGEVPVVGREDGIFGDPIGRAAAGVAWPLVRSGSRAWRLSGTRRVTDGFERDTITASVIFAGSASALHARCTMPTVRDLRSARTVVQARAIVARAGYGHVRVGAKRTRAARRSHFYIDEGIGNTNPIRCGYGGLHLLRSLGWS